MIRYRITAEARSTGRVEIIRRPRSLKGAADYLRRESYVVGTYWEGVTLELDNGHGWRTATVADLVGLDRDDLRELRGHVDVVRCPHCKRAAATWPSSNLCGDALMGRACKPGA